MPGKRLRFVPSLVRWNRQAGWRLLDLVTSRTTRPVLPRERSAKALLPGAQRLRSNRDFSAAGNCAGGHWYASHRALNASGDPERGPARSAARARDRDPGIADDRQIFAGSPDPPGHAPGDVLRDRCIRREAMDRKVFLQDNQGKRVHDGLHIEDAAMTARSPGSGQALSMVS